MIIYKIQLQVITIAIYNRYKQYVSLILIEQHFYTKDHDFNGDAKFVNIK